MGNIRLNEKQKAFCEYYLESLNAYESAIKAGYSENYAKAQSYKMLEKVGIKSYIDKKLKELEDERIAKADEVLKHLTSIMRGEITEETPILIGEGMQQLVPKEVNIKDRIKAAELLGRRYALFTDKQDVDIKVPKIIFDIQEDDENDKD